MPSHHTSQQETRPGSLVEAHKGYNPRILVFYVFIAALLITLVGGLAYQQLLRGDLYHEQEKRQSQRRILMPGPRGNIYDREGRLLVGNRARFAAILYLDELAAEFRGEWRTISKNYSEFGKKERPSPAELSLIAQHAVVQRYLDKVNAITGRTNTLRPDELTRHFSQTRLLPFTLVDDLSDTEYAKLIEQLPVTSPLQVYAFNVRHYPYASAAAHTLGYVTADENIEAADFPGDDLPTFRMKGSKGKSGLEAAYDTQLEGKPGGAIYRVDPAGYRIQPPLQKRLPVQGGSITTSLDIDLQLASEAAIAEHEEIKGAAIALDVRTGEILALASKPDYDLTLFTSRLKQETYDEIQKKGAEYNRAVNGIYPPGSTFKILTAIAGFRQGAITPATEIYCPGNHVIGKHTFDCHDGKAHGDIIFPDAVSMSCNVFFYMLSEKLDPATFSAEARRFGFGSPTGLALPETKASTLPDAIWKKKRTGEAWFGGDTAQMAIGQGYVTVTPLQMACFVASLARGQTRTTPVLLHDPSRLAKKNEDIGITSSQYSALVEGMVRCVNSGTGKSLKLVFKHNIPVAGKSGTAQKRATIDGKAGIINFAWFICFAPADKPEVALAVMLEGDELDTEFGGGRYAGSVAGKILQAYFDKKTRPAKPALGAGLRQIP